MTSSLSPDARLATRRPLFWEISPERISVALRDNDEWAIVRIFEYGTLDDISDCIEFCGEKKVAEILSHSQLRPTAYVMGYLFLRVDPQKKYF